MVTWQGPTSSQSRQGRATAKARQAREETGQRSGVRNEERSPESGPSQPRHVRSRGRSRSTPTTRVSRALPDSGEGDHALGGSGIGRVPKGSRNGPSSGTEEEEEARVSAKLLSFLEGDVPLVVEFEN